MSKRTRKAVKAVLDEQYVFANFNILIYAENYVFPAAADRDMKELNREELYDLYYAARDLEPQPKHAELNYS